MTFRIPNLDDRTAQDIVDAMKRRIPLYCPEWTDNNVSDPGVALIELFAWMAEMVIHKMNQTTDLTYLRLLELYGISPAAARAARAEVDFRLNGPARSDILVPKGTEVRTRRRELDADFIAGLPTDDDAGSPLLAGQRSRTNEPVVFTTVQAAAIRVPKLLATFTYSAVDTKFEPAPAGEVRIFGDRVVEGNGVYFVFAEGLSRNLLELHVKCLPAAGLGADPLSPAREWEVYAGASKWATAEVVEDQTQGFNNSQTKIVLRLPDMERSSVQDADGFVLRCIMRASNKRPPYQRSPVIQLLRVDSLGVSAPVEAWARVRDEVLGRSDGEPGQSFQLARRPVLPLDDLDGLIVEARQAHGQTALGEEERWTEVSSFASSGRGDKHFVLDLVSGTVRFGPAPLLANGARGLQHGAIPPRDARIWITYRTGGGEVGNVGPEKIEEPPVLPVAFRVTNRQAAKGGADAESLEQLKIVAPARHRARNRAITEDDYTALVLEQFHRVVSRAKTLAPGEMAGRVEQVRPGMVRVLILPKLEKPERPAWGERPRLMYLKPAEVIASHELRDQVTAFLQDKRTVGTLVEVESPKVVWVALNARIRPVRNARAEDVKLAAEAALCRYLHPLGGRSGRGWEFGQDVSVADLASVLLTIPEIKYVSEDMTLCTWTQDDPRKIVPGRHLDLPLTSIVGSRWDMRHSITIEGE